MEITINREEPLCFQLIILLAIMEIMEIHCLIMEITTINRNNNKMEILCFQLIILEIIMEELVFLILVIIMVETIVVLLYLTPVIIMVETMVVALYLILEITIMEIKMVVILCLIQIQIIKITIIKVIMGKINSHKYLDNLSEQILSKEWKMIKQLSYLINQFLLFL